MNHLTPHLFADDVQCYLESDIDLCSVIPVRPGVIFDGKILEVSPEVLELGG